MKQTPLLNELVTLHEDIDAEFNKTMIKLQDTVDKLSEIASKMVHPLPAQITSITFTSNDLAVIGLKLQAKRDKLMNKG